MEDSSLNVTASAGFLLDAIRDTHRHQCAFDPEADPTAQLTFNSTVAEWRQACHLIGRRHAQRHLRIGEAAGGTQGEAMRRMQYVVRISRDPDSDWGASVPDLPGCVATGKTIDSTLRRIERAIEIHLRGLREDGIAVPRPRHHTIRPRRKPREIDFYATVEVAA